MCVLIDKIKRYIHFFDENCKQFAWLVVATGAIILVVYFILLCINKYIYFTFGIQLEDSANVATFISGTVGVLWAFSGVLLFYSALKVQEKSLEEIKETNATQRELLKKTEEQISLYKTELQDSSKLLKRQLFETTFFNLVTQISTADRAEFEVQGMRFNHANRTKSLLENSNDPNRFNLPTNYAEYRCVIDFVQVALGLIANPEWGETVKPGTGKPGVFQQMKEPIEQKFRKFREFFVGVPEKTVRDQKAYGKILAASISINGKIVLLYYMSNCDSKYLTTALSLGLFDALPRDSFCPRFDPKQISEHVTFVDGITFVTN